MYLKEALPIIYQKIIHGFLHFSSQSVLLKHSYTKADEVVPFFTSSMCWRSSHQIFTAHSSRTVCPDIISYFLVFSDLWPFSNLVIVKPATTTWGRALLIPRQELPLQRESQRCIRFVLWPCGRGSQPPWICGAPEKYIRSVRCMDVDYLYKAESVDLVFSNISRIDKQKVKVQANGAYM
jgi:hypothetical protein